MTVQVPAKYVKADGEDLGVPIQELLRGLKLLEPAQEPASGPLETPYSLQVIKSGALSLSKWWVGIAGAVGTAGLSSSIVGALSSANEPTRVALVAAGGIIASAAAGAIAAIVRADVKARADCTVAQYRARSDLAGGFLETARTPAPASADGKAQAEPGMLGDLARAIDALLSSGSDGDADEAQILDVNALEGGGVQIRFREGESGPVDLTFRPAR